jgi:antitoxin (DNA-binding transcriptional repressor) of toxin-antitoxin stability system
MPIVNMHDAKTGLSKLVADIESGAEREIVIARNGKPVARLVPIEQPVKKQQLLGIAEGLFEFDYEEFQALDKVVQDQLEARWDRHDKLYGDVDAEDEKKSA